MSEKRGLETSSKDGEWKKMYSEKNSRHYWYNTVTNKSVWENPISDRAADVAQQAPAAKRTKFAVTDNMNTEANVVWKEGFSETYQRNYWFNELTGEKRWDDPVNPSGNTTEADTDEVLVGALTSPSAIAARLEKERRAVAVDEPSCPREITTADLPHIVRRLRTESASVVHDKNPNAEHPVVFRLPDDDTALITRAVQEDQILKTRLKVQLREGVKDLPSFWDVWKSDPEFRKTIINCPDPNEAKWRGQRTHNYKLATTFMPGYAKAIFEHFNAKTVLDPCAGWGDRLVGAASSSIVEKYVCFDPNTTLRPGYAALMKLYGHDCVQLTTDKLQFSNGFEAHALPFEEGALRFPDNSFDLAFTSPPFFDYEMYNPNNPQYTDWIAQFYKPLFIQVCRLIKPGHHFGIHVGDTSAGNIAKFLTAEVCTPLWRCSFHTIYLTAIALYCM